MMTTKKKQKEHRRFVFEDKTCRACHKDRHAAQFTANEPIKKCNDCHTAEQFRIDDFNHDKKTSYPLEGAHKKVACNLCHVQQTIKDIVVARYRPLGKLCKDCHAQDIGALTPAKGEI